MKHFEWTDFVRGLVEESARVAMEGHLASGCRKCRHTADLLQKAAVAARSDSKVHVPEYAVRGLPTRFLSCNCRKKCDCCPAPQRGCSTIVSANPCRQASARNRA